MVTTRGFDGMIRMLSKYGQELKNGDAQYLALCANIAHKAADTLEKRYGLPVLYIIYFLDQGIVNHAFKNVGLLATRASRLRERYGLEVFVPMKGFGEQADRLIFDELSKQPVSQEVKTTFEDAYASLLRDHQVDCVALACTELRLVFIADELNVPAFETTTLHAKGIAEWALQKE
ncbi:aspartate racemase [Penicillium robsamsonii]|uniref:aspartate racemase n=1 Tax=Penicillium robsamsonii TaxID=1792511 RepID=UPI002547A558|nr:aspartate racemase [Penicillium robsamsonii]KAJ5826588.1 aspartate racemase [Penicillium robsamsonii]